MSGKSTRPPIKERLRVALEEASHARNVMETLLRHVSYDLELDLIKVDRVSLRSDAPLGPSIVSALLAAAELNAEFKSPPPAMPDPDCVRCSGHGSYAGADETDIRTCPCTRSRRG